MLAAAEENFRGVMNALVETRQKLEAGESSVADTELRRQLAAVHRAIQAVFDERKKLDDIRKAAPDLVAGYTLDLGEAERQVRSRIARLRADLDGDGIPEIAR